MHSQFRNVNHVFSSLVSAVDSRTIPVHETTSRYGDVIQISEPVIVTYQFPEERVLFNSARDCNPFFHVFESLWMLAGRNDVAPVAYFSSKIGEVASDDGKTFNGAYGRRWRRAAKQVGPDSMGVYERHCIVDQLKIIIEQLRKKPDCRRCVLQMWNVEDDLLKINTTKDVCCNTAAYFLVQHGCLDMTVTNRSNDLVWGMLGANVVHFSFLQEYMAAGIGVRLGKYHQVTNNLHVYKNNWNPKLWLSDHTGDLYPKMSVSDLVPLVRNFDTFNKEVVEFIDHWQEGHEWAEPFLQNVARPMCEAFMWHKERDYDRAQVALSFIRAKDWREVATDWINKRQKNWEDKKSGKTSSAVEA